MMIWRRLGWRHLINGFSNCRSIDEIVTNNVRAIKDQAFCHCLGLTVVSLGDGLEEMGAYAF
jgi:hypothetical protein